METFCISVVRLWAWSRGLVKACSLAQPCVSVSSPTLWGEGLLRRALSPGRDTRVVGTRGLPSRWFRENLWAVILQIVLYFPSNVACFEVQEHHKIAVWVQEERHLLSVTLAGARSPAHGWLDPCPSQGPRAGEEGCCLSELTPRFLEIGSRTLLSGAIFCSLQNAFLCYLVDQRVPFNV